MMNREEALDIIYKALDKYYENKYNGYLAEKDRNNMIYTTLEAIDVVTYLKENLK